MYKDIEYKSGVFIGLSTLFRLSGWALIKNTVWHVTGWWVGTSKEYRRKLDMDMIGMIPHHFVYKDFTAPKLHDTCKRVAYDSWTGMKVTVIYESELDKVHPLMTASPWRRQGRQGMFPDSKLHGANMGPIKVLSAPDGPHDGPMILAIRVRAEKWHTCVILQWLSKLFHSPPAQT